jgi:hypothetical protein
VVKHADTANCASLSPQYSPSPPMPSSSHTTSKNVAPIWLPHWPAYM